MTAIAVVVWIAVATLLYVAWHNARLVYLEWREIKRRKP